MTLTAEKPQTKTTSPFITWLFVAYFEDGTVIGQTQEDKCTTRTDGTGSAFSDVLAKDGLIKFALERVNEPESVVVDLITGEFSVNGTPVIAHNQFFEPQKYDLELVYFRETRVDQKVDSDGKRVSLEHYVNRHFIGWKTQVNGKEKQVTLAVG